MRGEGGLGLVRLLLLHLVLLLLLKELLLVRHLLLLLVREERLLLLLGSETVLLGQSHVLHVGHLFLLLLHRVGLLLLHVVLGLHLLLHRPMGHPRRAQGVAERGSPDERIRAVALAAERHTGRKTPAKAPRNLEDPSCGS